VALPKLALLIGNGGDSGAWLALLILASASWWVAAREMGDPAFISSVSLIWLIAVGGLLLAAGSAPP